METAEDLRLTAAAIRVGRTRENACIPGGSPARILGEPGQRYFLSNRVGCDLDRLRFRQALSPRRPAGRNLAESSQYQGQLSGSFVLPFDGCEEILNVRR